MNYKEGGFDPKRYKIQKADGSPINPEAKHFVLRYDKDPHALLALQVYAASIATDNEQYSTELREEIVRVLFADFGLELLVKYLAVSKAYKEMYHPEEVDDE